MTVYKCSRCHITTDVGLCRNFDTPDGYPEMESHDMLEWIEDASVMSLDDIIAMGQQADDLWMNPEDWPTEDDT